MGLPQDAAVREQKTTRFLTSLGFPECAPASAAETAPPGKLPETVGLSGANCRSYVLDKSGDLLPPGFPGELYLGGVQVSGGWLNQPELSASFFVPDPFQEPKKCSSGKLFRTGLLVLRRPDGRMDFLAKLDASTEE